MISRLTTIASILLLAGSCRPATSVETAPHAPPREASYRQGPQGQVDRVQGEQCRPPPPSRGSCSAARRDCRTDADCTAQPYGRCEKHHGWVDPQRFDPEPTSRRGSRKASRAYARASEAQSSCACRYPCMSDEDCGEGALCACSSSGGGTCIAASCRTGEDCPGTACGESTYFDGCNQVQGFHCRTTHDACRGDDDCPDGGTCSYDALEHRWTCEDRLGCNY